MDADNLTVLVEPGLINAHLQAALAPLAVAGKKPDFSAEALTAKNGFAGMGGIFRLLPSGLVQRGLAVMQVEANSVNVIDPPPESFEDLSN